MNYGSQKETTILKVTFTTDPVYMLGGRYVSDSVRLDQTLLRQLSKNIEEVVLYGYPSESAYSIMQIKIVYAVEVFKNTNCYREAVQDLHIGPPLPKNKFEELKFDCRHLISTVITYLSWRRKYGIERGYIHENEIHWHWEADGHSGDDSHEPIITEIPGEDYVYVPIVPDVISSDDFRDFYALYKEGKAIPLHHEILREVSLTFNQVRSGYLILYSALEVASKALIKYKKPDVKWLIEELQSPNLYKLYSEYINKEIEIDIANESDLKNIKNMTSIRNNIAHKGNSLSEDILLRHNNFVRNFIAKIDVAMGYDWAIEIEEN